MQFFWDISVSHTFFRTCGRDFDLPSIMNRMQRWGSNHSRHKGMMYWQRNGAEFTQQFLGGEGGSVWLVAEKCTIWEQRWFSWTLSFLPKYLWPGLFLGQKFGIQTPMKGMIRKIQIPKKNNESLDESWIMWWMSHLFADEVLQLCTVVQAGELPEVIKARESLGFDLPGWFI